MLLQMKSFVFISTVAFIGTYAGVSALPQPDKALKARIDGSFQINLYADSSCSQFLSSEQGTANAFLDNTVSYSGPEVTGALIAVNGGQFDQMQLNGQFVCSDNVNILSGAGDVPDCDIGTCFAVPNGGLSKIDLSVGQDFSFDLPGK